MWPVGPFKNNKQKIIQHNVGVHCMIFQVGATIRIGTDQPHPPNRPHYKTILFGPATKPLPPPTPYPGSNPHHPNQPPTNFPTPPPPSPHQPPTHFVFSSLLFIELFDVRFFYCVFFADNTALIVH